MSAMTLSREIPKPRPITDFQHLADAVSGILPCDELILLTTMPRGGLQVCRALHASESAVRRYSADSHAADAIAWHAIQRELYVPNGKTNDRVAALTFGYETLLAVRIDGPVFDGYPGVLLVLQRDGQESATFDPARAASQLRAAFDTHVRRGPATPAARAPRQFIFANGKSLLPAANLSSLDPKMAQSIEKQLSVFTSMKDHANGTASFSLPDSTANCWPVQFVKTDSYPALSDGPVVFVSLHPQFHDWQRVGPNVFASDPEVARLAAAVPFIVQHYRRGPTLEEVSASVHLSQFHFHRRFSEVFGMTPKDVLYDLQLNEAKRLLADARQQLADIARHCGFSHQSHFTSRFKQGTGLTPTRWRRVNLMTRGS